MRIFQFDHAIENQDISLRLSFLISNGSTSTSYIFENDGSLSHVYTWHGSIELIENSDEISNTFYYEKSI